MNKQKSSNQTSSLLAATPRNVAELSDVETLRRQASTDVEQGAVTAGYSADRQKVLRLLNDS